MLAYLIGCSTYCAISPPHYLANLNGICDSVILRIDWLLICKRKLGLTAFLLPQVYEYSTIAGTIVDHVLKQARVVHNTKPQQNNFKILYIPAVHV